MNLSEYFKSGYILVVDDEMNMRKTIRNILRVIGIGNILEAEDGKEALRVLKEIDSGNGKKRCLFILSDWNMKYMNGPEFVKEVRGNQKFENVPILMVTANLDRSYVTQSIESGVNGYMVKPLTPVGLEKKILNIMDARANPPEHVRFIIRGEGLLKQEKHREALKEFERALDLAPDTARILVLLGETHEKLNSFDQAIKLYEKASEINPNYIKAHTMRAQFFINRGDRAAALEPLEMAAKISPNNSDRQVELGSIYLGDGKIKKARSAYDLAVKHEPKKNKEIGESFLKAGMAVDAEFFFRESLKLGRESMSAEEKEDVIEIYNRLGIALRRQGRWADAVVEYKLAVKLGADDEVLFYNMGKAHMEGGEMEEAVKCFRKALLIDPEFQEAREELKTLS